MHGQHFSKTLWQRPFNLPPICRSRAGITSSLVHGVVWLTCTLYQAPHRCHNNIIVPPILRKPRNPPPPTPAPLPSSHFCSALQKLSVCARCVTLTFAFMLPESITRCQSLTVHPGCHPGGVPQSDTSRQVFLSCFLGGISSCGVTLNFCGNTFSFCFAVGAPFCALKMPLSPVFRTSLILISTWAAGRRAGRPAGSTSNLDSLSLSLLRSSTGGRGCEGRGGAPS